MGFASTLASLFGSREEREPAAKDRASDEPTPKRDPASAEADIEEARANLRPRMGTSGTKYQHGEYEEEYHADLKDWRDRVARLNEVRIGDSVTAALLARREYPLLQAEWEFEAAEEPEPMPSEAAAMKTETDEAAGEGMPGAPSKPPTKALATQPPPRAEERSFAGDFGDAPEASTDEAEEESPEDLARRDADERLIRILRANLLGDGPPEYRMRTSWRQFMHEGLTASAFGVSLFERTLKPVSGELGDAVVIDALYWLRPDSVLWWHLDEDGELLGVTQEVIKGFWTLGGEKLDARALAARLAADPKLADRLVSQSELHRAFIPRDRLVVAVRRREGSNFEGTSDIRAAYADAKHGAFLRRIQRVSADTAGTPIANVTITNEAPPNAADEAERIARRMKAGNKETQWIVSTPGITPGYVKPEVTGGGYNEEIRATQFRIALLFGVEHALLGSEGSGGSYSAAETQSSYFDLAVDELATWFAETVEREIVEPLVALNAPGQRTPRLRYSGTTPINHEAILSAKQAGAITWTVNDEQGLRETFNLAALDADEIARRERQKAMAEEAFASMTGAEGGDTTKAGPKVPGRGAPSAPAAPPSPPKELSARPVSRAYPMRPLRRDLTEHETKHVPLQEIDEWFVDFERDVMGALRPLRDALVVEAVEKAHVDAAAMRVTFPNLGTKAMRSTLQALAARMRANGRSSARREIASQLGRSLSRKALATAPQMPPPRPIAQRTDADVARAIDFSLSRILGRVKDAVSNGVTMGLRRGWSTEDSLDEARREGLDESPAVLHEVGRQLGTVTFNGGRSEEVEEMQSDGIIVGRIVARRTEVLDERTCGACEGLDGVVADIDSDEYLDLMPPAGCDGAWYCRGFYTFEVV